MTTSRFPILLMGGALAITAGLLADQGSILGAALPQAALLGTCLGAVLALVPDRSVPARLIGLLAGVVAAWVGYGLRAGVLPDIPLGRAIAAVVVVGAVTAVAVATAGRVPLWAGLLGVGAMVGAYETTFAANPTSFVTDSMTAATTLLVAAALAVLVATTVATPRPVPLDDGEDVSLDALLLPAPRTSVDAEVEQEARR